MRFLSLFSGIEAASVAWMQLGWECVGVAEIEAFPCVALKHHYPDVANLGDITKITEAQIRALGHIDLVVGGFPCQDVSVAGKRAGFQGERSVLFFDAMRVVRWSGARWVVIENVPGLFSTHAGRDFASVVGELAGCDFDVPKDGWRNSGACVGPHGLVEWSTLDAQFFGLAQRRERVFLVADSGDWTRRPPVLLERESMCGDPPSRRKARERVAAGTLRSTRGGSDVDHAKAGHLVEAFGGNDTRGPIEISTALRAHGSAHQDFESETFIAGTLQASGKAAGSATQRDVESGLVIPVVAASLAANAGRCQIEQTYVPAIAFDEHSIGGDITPTLASGQNGGGRNAMNHPCVAFSCKDHGADATEDLAPTLRSMNEVDGNANAGGQVAVAIPITADALRGEGTALTPSPDAEGRVRLRDPGLGIGEDGDPAGTLAAAGPGAVAVAFKPSHYTRDKDGAPSVVFPPLSADADKGDQDAVVLAPEGFDEVADPVAANQARTYTREGENNFRVSNVAIHAMRVRRLTPIECERLQGFEDNYTLIDYRGKTVTDSPRYKALGNSMATTVMLWIGRSIERAARWAT